MPGMPYIDTNSANRQGLSRRAWHCRQEKGHRLNKDRLTVRFRQRSDLENSAADPNTTSLYQDAITYARRCAKSNDLINNLEQTRRRSDYWTQALPFRKVHAAPISPPLTSEVKLIFMKTHIPNAHRVPIMIKGRHKHDRTRFDP